MSQYTESVFDKGKENDAITTLKEHMKALNQKMTEKIDEIIDLQNMSLYLEAHLTIGFKLSHIEKFYGNTPPQLHFKAYVWTKQLHGLNKAHLAQGFH